MAEELWGSGKITNGKQAAEVLAQRGVPPDFSATAWLRHIHRATSDADIYFVANPEPRDVAAVATFRVHGKQPELWWPDNGQIEQAGVFTERDGVTNVPLRLGPSGSVFVVFPKSPVTADPVVAVTHNGSPILPPVLHEAKIVIVKAVYGPAGDPARTRDVRAEVQALVNRGTLGFCVWRMAEGGDPAPNVVKTLVVDYLADGKPLRATGRDPESIRLRYTPPAAQVAEVRLDDHGRVTLEAWQAGRYELTMASGKLLQYDVQRLPASAEIAGPWELAFPPNSGAPAHVTLDTLVSWSEHKDPGVRYFSGTATYRTQFEVPAEKLRQDRRIYLDLGRVEIMAEAKLNGHDLGILWKTPYRLDVTGAIRAGQNVLELKVVNLWVNRMIGDEQLPDDSPRTPDGTLTAWPQWLLDGKASPTGRHTFTSWRLWKKDDPLVPSGLIGPVTLRFTELHSLPLDSK